MFGISNTKFSAILFLVLAIFIALFIGSYTTYFTSYHSASLPNVGKQISREGMSDEDIKKLAELAAKNPAVVNTVLNQ